MNSLTIHGREHLSAKPALYLPNRLTPETLRALYELLGSKACFLSDTGCPPSPELAATLQSIGAFVEYFPFRQTTPLAVREQVSKQFEMGRSVIYLPGAVAQLRGCISDVPAPYLMALGSLHISTIPVHVEQYGDTIETFVGKVAEGGRQVLSILPKLSPGPQAGARVLAAWMESAEEQMQKQPLLASSLTTMLVQAMKRHPKAEVIDGLTGATANNMKLLGVSMALAKRLRKLGVKRMGVILPPGPAAVIATLSCLLAGITAVMMSYASPRESIESAIRQAGLTRFLTAHKFKQKLPAFAWPEDEQLLFMEDELGAIGKVSLLAHILMARTLPAGLICRRFNTEARRDRDEAVMLFTSGSSGEPKGVILTHRMILGNVAQGTSRITFENERFLGSLPVFHSFGLTISMIMPLLCGFTICTYPNPTDARRLDELVREHRLTLLCATPTFARAMLRRADKDTFESVRYFILGAEKLPRELQQAFMERHNLLVQEGYGLTEAAPICSGNLPDAPLLEGTAIYVPGTIHGSVGGMLPGMAVRITDLDDDNVILPVTEQGMIWLKGPNMFSGYVGRDDLNREVIKDGWFKTGDIGRLDLNGFLYLSGRLARFSKIGGEMVPHEGVEQAVNEALGLNPADDGMQVAITAVPDEQKGEALVLLSALLDLQREEGRKAALARIRAAFSARSIPNLWIPRHLLPVEQIPILPTGKLDMRRCKLLATEVLTPATEALMNAGESLRNSANEALASASESLKAAGESLKASANEALATASDSLKNAGESIRSSANEAIANAEDTLKSVEEALTPPQVHA